MAASVSRCRICAHDGIPPLKFHSRFAVHADRAGVGLIDSSENLHQRRLARAIFPDNTDDFATVYFKLNRIQSHNARKAFRDCGHGEQQWWLLEGFTVGGL